MEIVVSGRHIEVPEPFRRLAEEKLLKIGQLAPKAHRTDVELSHERNPRQSQHCEKVEITVRGKGPVIRAEASAEDPAAALDIAFGKLLERLRRSGDRRKVHHGRQTPPSLRLTPAGGVPGLDTAAPSGAAHSGAGRNGVSHNGVGHNGAGHDGAGHDGAGHDGAGHDGAGHDGAGHDGAGHAAGAHDEAGDHTGESPIVIRAKDHDATPMSLDQALYEMELVGHDFYLFVDADSGCPSVVYRRRGWNYGVIRLTPDPAHALKD